MMDMRVWGVVLVAGLTVGCSGTGEPRDSTASQQAASPERKYEQAQEALQKGDGPTALAHAKEAAQGGHVPAMALTGILIRATKGNDAEALGWFKRGSKEGNELATVYLAAMHEEGAGGLKADSQASARVLREGADAGQGLCMFWLGQYYQNGIGVSKDGERAVRWYTRSAEAGTAKAATALANLYFNKKDLRKEREWRKRAADAGDATSMFLLGKALLEEGIDGEDEKYDQGLKLLDRTRRLKPLPLVTLGDSEHHNQAIQLAHQHLRSFSSAGSFASLETARVLAANRPNRYTNRPELRGNLLCYAAGTERLLLSIELNGYPERVVLPGADGKGEIWKIVHRGFRVSGNSGTVDVQALSPDQRRTVVIRGNLQLKREGRVNGTFTGNVMLGAASGGGGEQWQQVTGRLVQRLETGGR